MIELVYYRHNVNHAQIEIPKYKINYNELTILLKGELSYKVDGKVVKLSSGDGIFIKSGSFRERKAVSDTDYVSFNFKSEREFDLPVYFSSIASDVVCNLISAIDSIYKYTTNLEDERFKMLLNCILIQLKVQRLVELEPQIVNKIKNYVRLNLDKKITLFSVGEELNYSVSHCEMVFKQATGLSITAYVIKKRIEKAKQLLIERVLTLPEVAERVGFSDYNYFSRVFKKEVGVSPINYRKSF
jgi:YesN/AraC family two-component response regulator